MYRVIMVPSDGSALSTHAIPLALALARPVNAIIRIVGVFETPPVAAIYGTPVATGTLTGGVVGLEAMEEERAARRDAQADELSELARQLSTSGGVIVETAVEEGQVVDALRRYATSHHVDMIVIATHGRSGIGRAVLGSVADALIRSVRCPVLLARAHGESRITSTEPASVRHVLVPLDETPEGDAIVEHAVTLAAVTGARCTLLHVSGARLLSGINAPDALVDPETRQRVEDGARAYLERAAETFRARGIDTSTIVRCGANPADAIIEYASTEAVDLLAMATHGRHGIQRLALGSVATELLKRTLLPMLLVRSDHQDHSGLR
jgi:nucleotide-binding universal stress UspA family protein